MVMRTGSCESMPPSSSMLTTGGKAFSGSPLNAIRYSKSREEEGKVRGRGSLDDVGCMDIRQLLDK